MASTTAANSGGKGRMDLLRSGSTALFVRMCGMGVTYLFNVIVARAYGAEASGIFALCTTIVMACSMVGRFGLDRAMVRFVAVFRSRGEMEQVGRYYAVALALVSSLSIVFAIGLFLAGPAVARIVFHKPHLGVQLQLVSPAVLLFGIVLLNGEVLRGLKLIAHFAIVRYASIYAFATLAIVLLAFVIPVAYRPNVAFTVGAAAAALVSTVLVLRRVSLVAEGSMGTLRPMLAMTAPMFLSSSMGMVMQWADVMIMGRFASDSTVGIYSMALKLAFLVSMGLEAVNSTTAPRLAEAYGAGDRDAVRVIMKDATRVLFWASLPLVVVLGGLAGPVLGLFGSEFRAGATALVILMIGQFVSAISGPIGSFLQMTGSERSFMYIVILCGLLNVVLNLLLIPRYGMIAAAIVSASTLALNNLLCVAVVRRRFGFISLYLPVRGLNR